MKEINSHSKPQVLGHQAQCLLIWPDRGWVGVLRREGLWGCPGVDSDHTKVIILTGALWIGIPERVTRGLCHSSRNCWVSF